MLICKLSRIKKALHSYAIHLSPRIRRRARLPRRRSEKRNPMG